MRISGILRYKSFSAIDSKPTVFISAYRNVSVRYILDTDIFRVLKKSGIRIVVFVKEGDLGFFKKKFSGNNIVFQSIFFEDALSEVRSGWKGILALSRRMFSGKSESLINTTDKVWKEVFSSQSNDVLSRFRLSIAIVLAFFGRKSSGVRKLLLTLECALSMGKQYDHYFTKYNPNLLIVSSIGYMIDPLMMRSAKRFKCKIISIIHSWDNPTTKGYRGGQPDIVIAWNEIMKKELNIFHDIEEKNIVVGGIAHWDVYFNGQIESRSKNHIIDHNFQNINTKILLYCTSAPVLFRNTFDVIEIILDGIEKDCFCDSIQLLVRLHPHYLHLDRRGEGQIINQYKTRMEFIEKRYKDIVLFNLPLVEVAEDDVYLPSEDIMRLGELLTHSDVLLTEYSTLMIEGAIFDLPIINVALNYFRDMKKPTAYVEEYAHLNQILKMEFTRQAYSKNELFKHINDYLLNPSLDSDARKNVVKQQVTTNVGFAGQSIAKYIQNLVLD